MVVRLRVAMLARPCLLTLAWPSTIFLGDWTYEINLAGRDRDVGIGVLHVCGEDNCSFGHMGRNGRHGARRRR